MVPGCEGTRIINPSQQIIYPPGLALGQGCCATNFTMNGDQRVSLELDSLIYNTTEPRPEKAKPHRTDKQGKVDQT